MAAFEVSVFQATPANYEMVLANGWKGDPFIDFLVGGEAFRPSLLPITDKAGGRCKSLRNVYVPTETTIWLLSYTDLAMVSASVSVQVPIGSATIRRTSLYVVAEKLNPQEAWREVEFRAEG
jgi:non-ribosomal peptide synthetase component F